jgi:hypothetical protein
MRIDVTGKQARDAKGGIALCVAFCFVFCLAVAAAQSTNQSGPRSTVKGFRAPLEYFDPPYELQVKSFLEGTEAVPGANGVVSIRDAILLTYHEDGSKEMIVTAPQCTYDSRQYIVSSAGPLQVRKLDDNIQVQGVGFYWLQTNSYLRISNQQQTTVYGKLTNTFSP